MPGGSRRPQPLNHDGGLLQPGEHRLLHFLGSAHRNKLDPVGWMQCGGPADQNGAGAAAECGFRDRIAHFAAGVVAQVTHRVQRFLSGPGGHQQRFLFQVALDSSISSVAATMLAGEARRPAPVMPQAK